MLVADDTEVSQLREEAAEVVCGERGIQSDISFRMLVKEIKDIPYN